MMSALLTGVFKSGNRQAIHGDPFCRWTPTKAAFRWMQMNRPTIKCVYVYHNYFNELPQLVWPATTVAFSLQLSWCSLHSLYNLEVCMRSILFFSNVACKVKPTKNLNFWHDSTYTKFNRDPFINFGDETYRFIFMYFLQGKHKGITIWNLVFGPIICKISWT
jgi:hypothetical protein